MATLAELEQQRASFGQSRSVVALVRQKLCFRENFRESFALSARFFRENKNAISLKLSRKKTKSKTFLPTLIKYVVKPHHFYAALTPSQYF
jgi:hypothetical protein